MAQMSTIISVEARTVRIPLSQATAFARRQVTSRDYSLVRIRTEDGVEGIGHCYAGHSGGNVVTTAVREMLAPMLIGADSHATELLWKNMYQEVLLHGRVGSVMRALSILDNALWDRNARAANLPLYKYLGAAYEDTVPAYASGGYYLEGKTPAMLGEEMASYVALGLNAVKMKVGRGDLRSEEARIEAARKAIGPDVLLMLAESLNEQGQLYVMDELTADADLVSKLQAVSQSDVDQRIYLRASKAVPYGRVAEIMAAVTSAGFKKVALVTEPIKQ